jgi:hypothetical protein
MNINAGKNPLGQKENFRAACNRFTIPMREIFENGARVNTWEILLGAGGAGKHIWSNTIYRR